MFYSSVPIRAHPWSKPHFFVAFAGFCKTTDPEFFTTDHRIGTDGILNLYLSRPSVVILLGVCGLLLKNSDPERPTTYEDVGRKMIPKKQYFSG